MKKIILLACLIVFTISAGFTQPPPPPDPDDFPPPDGAGPIDDDMMQKFRTMKMWKLTEELDITEEQAAKFYPKFNAFEDKVEEFRLKNKDLLDKLRGYLIAGDEEKNITNIITQIEKNDEEILQLHKKFRDDAGKILTTEQLGKLILFQHEFPKRFRDSFRGKRPMRDHNKGREGMMNSPQSPPPGISRGIYGCR